MTETKKCLDTYALLEIYLGNEKFLPYTNISFVITDITLAEFFGVMLREYGEDEATFWYDKLKDYSVHVKKEILIKAVRFRQKHIKQRISFFDAVGYIYSIENGYKFVTGDKEFENFDGVEFLRK
jgi:predicted nucleic acid-binding protein